MQLNTQWVNYGSEAGEVAGYLARPVRVDGPLPGVVVLQEIWGVDAHIQDLAERFAVAGYVAIAPDLYSAGEKPAALVPQRIAAAKAWLDGLAPQERGKVFGDADRRAELLGALPAAEGEAIQDTLGALMGPARGSGETHLQITEGAVTYLRADAACVGRAIGAVGFCLGGGLSLRLASRDAALGGAVVFYGASLERDQVDTVRCPIRGFYGEDDPRIVSGLGAFAADLDGAGADHELRVYANAGHAFFNDTRDSYNADAARDAWGATLGFFARTLGPAATVALA